MANKQRTERLSLREISRRLGIPPSSVAYYKDRFGAYIPTCPAAPNGSAGHGAASSRRPAYPPEALQIFQEIRDMYTQQFSSDAIAEDLAAKSAARMGQGVGPAHPMQDGFDPSPTSAAALYEKLSHALEAQAGMRKELQALKDEMASLRATARDLDAQLFEERAQRVALSLELQEVRDDLTRQSHQANSKRQAGEKRGATRAGQPSATYMDLPLVIRTANNEYLGVAGRTKAFSLRDFVTLVESGGRRRRGQATLSWQRQPPRWVLRLCAADPDTGLQREHRMEVARTTTPNGNEVMQITRLAMDGVDAPEPFLLVLFRKIKEEFDA